MASFRERSQNAVDFAAHLRDRGADRVGAIAMLEADDAVDTTEPVRNRNAPPTAINVTSARKRLRFETVDEFSTICFARSNAIDHATRRVWLLAPVAEVRKRPAADVGTVICSPPNTSAFSVSWKPAFAGQLEVSGSTWLPPPRPVDRDRACGIACLRRHEQRYWPGAGSPAQVAEVGRGSAVDHNGIGLARKVGGTGASNSSGRSAKL